MNFSLSSETNQDGADAVVSLEGEVDLYTAPELKQELHRLVGEGAKRIVIDMANRRSQRSRFANRRSGMRLAPRKALSNCGLGSCNAG